MAEENREHWSDLARSLKERYGVAVDFRRLRTAFSNVENSGYVALNMIYQLGRLNPDLCIQIDAYEREHPLPTRAQGESQHEFERDYWRWLDNFYHDWIQHQDFPFIDRNGLPLERAEEEMAREAGKLQNRAIDTSFFVQSTLGGEAFVAFVGNNVLKILAQYPIGFSSGVTVNDVRYDPDSNEVILRPDHAMIDDRRLSYEIANRMPDGRYVRSTLLAPESEPDILFIIQPRIDGVEGRQLSSDIMWASPQTHPIHSRTDVNSMGMSDAFSEAGLLCDIDTSTEPPTGSLYFAVDEASSQDYFVQDGKPVGFDPVFGPREGIPAEWLIKNPILAQYVIQFYDERLSANNPSLVVPALQKALCLAAIPNTLPVSHPLVEYAAQHNVTPQFELLHDESCLKGVEQYYRGLATSTRPDQQQVLLEGLHGLRDSHNSDLKELWQKLALNPDTRDSNVRAILVSHASPLGRLGLGIDHLARAVNLK
jgi:hypothetical protein